MGHFQINWTLPTVPDDQIYTFSWTVSGSGTPTPPRPIRPPPPPPRETNSETPPPPYYTFPPPPPPSSPAPALFADDREPPNQVLDCPTKITFHIIRVPRYSHHTALWKYNNVTPTFDILDVPAWTPMSEALKALGAGETGWAVTEALSWAACPTEKGPGSWTRGACLKVGDNRNPATIGEVDWITVGGNQGRKPVFIVAHKVGATAG